MPIPKPSSDNYGSPSDAGIMGEDYRLDQARFHEVTDKELEAFQKVVTEIATGKEEPDPIADFTMQELEHLLSSRLRDVQDATRGLEAAIARLQSRREDERWRLRQIQDELDRLHRQESPDTPTKDKLGFESTRLWDALNKISEICGIL